jgi:hypothetical protein
MTITSKGTIGCWKDLPGVFTKRPGCKRADQNRSFFAKACKVMLAAKRFGRLHNAGTASLQDIIAAFRLFS